MHSGVEDSNKNEVEAIVPYGITDKGIKLYEKWLK